LARPAEPVTLTLASFAVTKQAYVRLTRLFRERHRRATGVDVRFRLAFAGSSVQARAVSDGLPADVVALAMPPDIERIVQAARGALVRPGWRARYPNHSVVCETTVAVVVRRGNPTGFSGWEDLARPNGARIVVANPKTAGVARWIFLALWGHRMRRGGDAAARDYVTRVFDNVVVQPRDAREASDVFYRQRVGDVLLTYENEAVLTNAVVGEDKALPYLVPSPNVRIECPLALVDGVLEKKPRAARDAADAFARFLFSPEAQAEFGRVGFRPNPNLSRELPEHVRESRSAGVRLWSVDGALGGWPEAQRALFDPGAVLDQIQSDVGGRRMEAQRAAASAASAARWEGVGRALFGWMGGGGGGGGGGGSTPAAAAAGGV
jgi:sulfate transport system substrate-binding protein